MMSLTMTFSVLGVIVTLFIITPVFLAFLFPLAVPYQLIRKYYMSSSRELKRLDSVSRSPM